MVCSVFGESFGLNLQHGAHRLVMMSMCNNVNILIQAIGRIHRHGQKKEQYVWVLNTDHTYDQLIQANAMQKMISQLSAELDVPSLTDQEYQERANFLGIEIDDEATGEIDRASMNNDRLREMADRHLQDILGLRCSRLGWKDKDFYAKDEEAARFPGVVRPIPDLMTVAELKGKETPIDSPEGVLLNVPDSAPTE